MYHNEYLIEKEKDLYEDMKACPYKKLLIFDAFGKKKEISPLLGKSINYMDTAHIHKTAKDNGFNIDSFPRFTTGMAAIIHCMKHYKSLSFVHSQLLRRLLRYFCFSSSSIIPHLKNGLFTFFAISSKFSKSSLNASV